MPGVTRHAPPQTVGAEVRRLRAQRSIREVTDKLGWSVSKLSRIETGQSAITAGDLTRLLQFYGADASEQSRIGALAQRPQVRSKRLFATLPGTLEKYVDLEKRASAISVYGALVVPALLQTPEYAAAIIKANPKSSSDIENARIENRMVRQAAVLARRPGPQLNIVIDEAALRRVIGDASIMQRQMLRLIEVGKRPDTLIRVLPFTVGDSPAQMGHFAILDFMDGTDTHVFCDGLTGGILRGNPDEVDLYRLCFKEIFKKALDEEASVKIFETAATSGWARQG